MGTADVKRHRITNAVAIRTALPEPRAWFIFDRTQGGQYGEEPTGDDWVELVEVLT